MIRALSKFAILFVAVVATSLLLSSAATAGPFTNIVVFGDSLSDIGNVSQATPFLTQPKTPGPYYWNGRFSNGPVYAETLATGLGLPALTRSTATGGTDYAYGGALTTGSDFATSFVVKDIDDQVSSYTTNHNGTASTLYVIFAGANDMIAATPNVSASIGSLQTSMEKLYTDGARQFLVINLPPLGYTPRFNGSQANITTYNTRSQNYNTALASMLTTLKNAHPAIALSQLDAYSLLLDARANPALYGLSNVTASAAPGLSPGATSYDTSLEAPNPNQYLFWDDLHPTANVHAILGRRGLDLFFPAGDYNRNVATDNNDFVLLKKGMGTTYQPIDYNIWRAHFGQATVGGAGLGDGSFGSSVPEPGTLAIGLSTIFALLVPPLRRRS